MEPEKPAGGVAVRVEADVGPEAEGRQAARDRKHFGCCPYTYANSGAMSMDDYAASGNNRKKDLWFAGWKAEKARLGLDHNMQPNDQVQPRAERSEAK